MRCILYPFLIMHWIVYRIKNKETKRIIDNDIKYMNKRCSKNKSLFYYLAYHPSYRNLFYYRLGGKCILLKFLAPPYPLFYLNAESIGECAFVLNHPYGTIVNAKSIGKNFTICQLTTIGNSMHGRNDLIPTIGNNVSLGANVTIIGNIRIGDNVVVGAGSVVVKDIPDNCIVAGVPAKVIKRLG